MAFAQPHMEIARDEPTDSHPVLHSPYLLAEILRHLTTRDLGRAAAVCRFWRQEVYQPDLWIDSVFTIPFNRSLDDKPTLLASLARRGIRRVFINVDGVTASNNLRLGQLRITAEPSVKEIHQLAVINRHLIYNFQNLARDLPNMTDLDLDSLNKSNLSFVLWQDMPQLNALRLSEYIDIDNPTWNTTNLKNLNTLTLSNGDQAIWLIESFRPENDPIFQKVRHLTFERCPFYMTDRVIECLSGFNGATQLDLESLRLFECRDLSDQSLMYLGAGQPQLKHLCLTGMKKLTHVGLQHVVAMRRLTFLDLTDCSRVDNACMEHISELPSLQCLILVRCAVGDEGLECLVSGGSMVTKLSLEDCIRITDVGLGFLAKLNSLRDLNVANCSGVSGMGLYFLSPMRCHVRIRHLDARGCYLLTTIGLLYIASCMQELRSLKLDWEQICKEGLVSAGLNLRWLTTLMVNDRNVIGLVHQARQRQ